MVAEWQAVDNGEIRLGVTSGLPIRVSTPRPLRGVGRRFGDLKVRPKLMVLHNAFFLVLTCAVYFSVVGFAEQRLREAAQREVTLVKNAFAALTLGGDETALRPYELRTGTRDEFGLPEEAVRFLSAYPGRSWQRDDASEHLYRIVEGSPRIFRVTLPLGFYSGLLARLKLSVFLVLGTLYVAAILLLELVIMPLYVYQPLDQMLTADAATRRGDRAAEFVPEEYIPGDEIGEIMRSRNETVREMRRHEDELERAAADLQRKNTELEAAKRNLESQDRLVSLGLLSASVAHEMNTPLAVLHGSIEKLQETIEDPSARSRLARMIRVTERLKRISEGLLGFSRVRNQEMSKVEMRPLVEEAWHLVAIDDRAKRIKFINRVPARLAVKGNPDRLIQVFVNLLRNALMAVQEDCGEISATARRAALDGRAAVSIRIEDNGPGIPAEVLPEIFDAFVTSRLDSRGTGLGLTVAHGIVTQHGGSITAANGLQGGAVLEVTLPAAEEEGENDD